MNLFDCGSNLIVSEQKLEEIPLTIWITVQSGSIQKKLNGKEKEFKKKGYN